MIGSAKQAFSIFGYVIASGVRQALPRTLATIRHIRRHPPLDEQEPPAWFVPVARAVLVLALAALGLATLLDDGAP